MLTLVFAALDTVIEGFEVDDLNGPSLHEFVVGIQQRLDRLAAVQASALARWNAQKIWTDDDSRSAGSRLSRETGLSLGDSRALIGRAKQLRSMPITASAFASGSLSSSRVDLLCLANQSGYAPAFARDESKLVDQVQSLRFSSAAQYVKCWRQWAAEESGKRPSDLFIEQRSASCSRTFEGTVDLRALFDPVGGEIFFNEHQRLEREMFEADWAEAKVVHGDKVTIDMLRRTPAQRRCDALVEMAKRSASRAVKAKAPRPLISVVCDRESFGRICRTASGTILSPEQIVPLLGEAQIERIVFDGPSRVLDLGYKRLFTGALRRALEIRDEHCQHPSVCDEPADKCQGDHELAYVNGGWTKQDNGRLLCDFHNRSKGSGPPG